ncbi:MAG: hypothetical protein RMK15_00025 [Chloroflexota bacterium]|nr:hypothetical protein [Dehalococcoidia bacterium]MDW8045657.1 hypothetical protein [Chloroflexota bacterium]
MNRVQVVMTTITAATALLAAVACSGGGERKVSVELAEWRVVANPAQVKHGKVTFTARNSGPEDPHELVVVRTDLPADQLPIGEDGGIDEEAVEVLGEIEPFGVGETQKLTLDLPPGRYVLLCNIVEVEEGQRESHYKKGMFTAFVVE